ncbi:MAG: hypothetical protein C4575_01730 [Desulforudis sp.]|jgi:hypothetical protein|nr:MAG: hypothetical protein C4575_01730 [Desulforudis sp.]
MSTTIHWNDECPIAQILRFQFAPEIAAAQEKYGIGPSAALCQYVCPAILGFSDERPDKTCAIRARFLKEISPIESVRERIHWRFDKCIAALNELFAPERK